MKFNVPPNPPPGTELIASPLSTFAPGQPVTPIRSTRCLTFWPSLLLVLSLIPFAGCGGCQPEPPPEDEKPEETELDDFETGELRVLPADDLKPTYGVKPGHWYSVRQQLKSNRVDFDGNLRSDAADVSQQPLGLSDGRVELQTQRPAVLPKGQAKSFELTYFVPHSAARDRRIWFNSQLQSRFGGGTRLTQSQLSNRMRAHQAYFVVLARNPDEYSYVKTLESIQPPADELLIGDIPGDYMVVMPRPESLLQIPSWPLMWSGIAYLLWDDFEPSLLTREQQQSLIDWLHWGGQIVVSGPKSLDTLKTSFLGDYLPADAGPTEFVSEERIATFNSAWSTPSKNPRVDTRLTIPGTLQLEAVQLQLRSAAAYVPRTAELVAEQRVGRGRIVVTGFSLARREITTWRSFDNFFNACLLRRPTRYYTSSDNTGLLLSWNGAIRRAIARRPMRSNEDNEYVGEPETEPASDFSSVGRRLPNESLLTSRVRYFSRDAYRTRLTNRENRPLVNTFDIEGYRCDSHAGIGGWNDFSECSDLARDSLTAAAGIVVPDRTFIMWALGLYLLVLVPVNWSLFRAIGRAEWAWMAVPLLATVGTVAIVRLAQLDIGFARSQTEITVVESQPGYSRAHVTRYVAVYTSLSTDYSISFPDDSAVVLPLSTRTARQFSGIRPNNTVLLQRSGKRDANVQLQQLSVSSNSTEMVHAEQFIDIQGGVRLNQRPGGLLEIINETSFDLLNIGIVRRHRGDLEFCGLPLLRAGTVLQIDFAPLPEEDVQRVLAETASQMAELPDGIQPTAFRLLAVDPARLQDGDVRLVGWTDAIVPGMTVEPVASQQSSWTLWVANLRYGPLADAGSDSNTRFDFPSEDLND